MNLEDRPDFIRQRRNLILINAALIVTYVTGLKFSIANVLGNMQATFAHPERVAVLMWIVAIYFLIRYYQCCREAGVLNKFIQEIYNARRSTVDQLLQTAAKVPHGLSAREFVFSIMKTVEQTLWAIEVEVELRDHQNNAVRANDTLRLKARELFAPNVRAFVKVWVNTLKGTEYFVPYLLFLCALMVWGARFF